MTTTPPEVASGKQSAGGRWAAARVGSGIFVSRVLGLVRERLIGHYFGTSDAADAWGVAQRLPNVIRNLLGEGTLSASMVPVYAELLEQGREEEARRFAGAALGIVTAVAATAALVGWLIAPWLVRLMLPVWSPEKQELTTSLVRILFPMVGIFVLSAWAMTILDSHRRFFVSYVAPALWNVATITALVGGALWLGDRLLAPGGDRELVMILAWGALIGGGLQFGLQLPFVLRHLGGLRLSLGRGVHGVREAIDNFVPVVTARGVVNLSGYVEIVLAGLLSAGAVAVLRYAQTLYMLPISLFGISVAASELPELSRMREEHRRELADRVSGALLRVTYLLIPSAVAYIALGDVTVAALFETGAFGREQTLVTWAVLAAFALGLPATASSRVLSSAFYALRDTRTPARMAFLRVGVSLVVGVAFMIPLDRYGTETLQFGAAGLALGTAVAAWIELLLLRRALHGKIGAHGIGVAPVARMVGAAAIAVAVALGIGRVVPPMHPIWAGVLILAPFGVTYLGVTHLLGVSIFSDER